MTDTPQSFPGVSLFWEIDSEGLLTIALRAPVVYARRFALPSDMLYQFLVAVQAQGVDIDSTENVRVRFDKNADAFLIRWSGRVLQNRELVHDVVPALSRQLGISSYGDQ